MYYSLEESGIWPLNYEALLDTLTPESNSNKYKLLSVGEWEELTEEHGSRRTEVLRIKPVVTRWGFEDTTSGLLLTSRPALQLGNQKHRIDRIRLVPKEKKLSKSAQKEAEAIDRVCAERLCHEATSLAFKIKCYVVGDRAPRPLWLGL